MEFILRESREAPPSPRFAEKFCFQLAHARLISRGEHRPRASGREMATAGRELKRVSSRLRGVHLAGGKPSFARVREWGMRPYGFIL